MEERDVFAQGDKFQARVWKKLKAITLDQWIKIAAVVGLFYFANAVYYTGDKISMGLYDVSLIGESIAKLAPPAEPEKPYRGF